MSTSYCWYKEMEFYSRVGTQNSSAFPSLFVKIVKMTEQELKDFLFDQLQKYYTDIVSGTGYVYAKGTDPVGVTAHMDTVHAEPVQDYYGFTRKDGTHVISSPQGIGGDDRCGVYMILHILETTDYRPTVLFCEQEEVGGIGSNKFVKDMLFYPEIKQLKFWIELDRANANDLVFYSDDNKSFHNWCEEITGYETNYGSFSDISHICPATETSGVNISCGYYNAHTLDEYVVLEEMMESIEATKKLIAASTEVKRFEYVKREVLTYNDYYFGKYNRAYQENVLTEFVYLDPQTGQEVSEVYEGQSDMECLGYFMLDHPEISYNEILDWNFC